MYDNNSRIIINANKVAHIEINSKGHPGKLKVVNGDVKVNHYNPTEMARAAEKIAHWISEKKPEQFQRPVPMELKDTPGTTICFSTTLTTHSIVFRKWR